MENKSKYIYLIVGILIGAIIVYAGMSLFSGSPSVNKVNVKSKQDEKLNNQDEQRSEFIKISDKVMKEFDIEVKTAGPGKLTVHKDLTGEIVPNPYKVSHIVPRFDGIVKAVYKKIGDKVKEGEVIATIESNESLVEYEVRSSISGTILELHMTPGELIGDRIHVVKIADLSSVWAELSVYQKDLLKINVGERVLITSPGSNYEFKGKIFYVSPTVNEVTRTSIARVNLGNVKGFWKPGLFITGRVRINEIRVSVIVPKTAIETLNDQTVVFVETDNGFKAQPVKIGISNDNYVQILSGLKDGQVYVAKNGFIIKSEIEKSKFAEDD